MIYSVAGELNNKYLISQRPYRSPHHGASQPSLVGGGSKAKPGEITLAHNGVLFLDEVAEFNKSILDALRQPMETGNIKISRVNSHVTYPAKFQLIAAMNPCRCGYFGDGERTCSKAPSCAEQYQSKISGPILDRIDLIIEVPQVDIKQLNPKNSLSLPALHLAQTSTEIKEKILRAKEMQAKRYSQYSILTNSEATGEIINETADLSKEASSLLEEAMQKFKFSTRAYYRLIKVARTAADLDNNTHILSAHMSEAISYRKVNYYNKLMQRPS
ncbi:YifB family Mg chelatase-like AAA ATPase C-terminal domain protein [Candidatus Hepatincolaceae symbiont of Richtersius coronifer]